MEKLLFPKSSQLRKGWEFDMVYSHGKRLHGSGFMLVCRRSGQDESRIGISVSRKIRGAVRRNRTKRIIRESFRLHRECYPCGADIVFVVRPEFSLSSPRDIWRAVESLTCKWTGTHED